MTPTPTTANLHKLVWAEMCAKGWGFSDRESNLIGIYAAVMQYIAGDPMFGSVDTEAKDSAGNRIKAGLHKPIVLIGPHGTGKSGVFETLNDVLRKCSKSPIPTVSVHTVLHRIDMDRMDNYPGCYDPYIAPPILLIEDLGGEYYAEIQHFREKIDPIKYILHLRLQMGKKTHITTAKEVGWLCERYGKALMLAVLNASNVFRVTGSNKCARHFER